MSPTTVDHAIAALALRQHGLISVTQLPRLGLTASAARDRVAAGRLHRIHRGVYAVGHRVLSREGRWMAAVLACGPGAHLGYRSAAALWEVRRTDRAAVDVIAPCGSRRRRDGIEIHRAGSLRPQDVTVERGIPCTTVARTLLDLAEIVDRRALERALDQAEILRLFDARALDELLAAARGRRGAAILRAILGEYEIGEDVPRSELEERFLAMCARARLPEPEVNAWIALPHGDHVQADFLWRAERLIVETDGRATHGTRRAFEHDRLRDQRLLIAGWRTIRCTWRQVIRDPQQLAQTVAAILIRTG